jgi:hypothetical protein
MPELTTTTLSPPALYWLVQPEERENDTAQSTRPYCSRCGQRDVGQTGEYPCVRCGVATVHDAPAK